MLLSYMKRRCEKINGMIMFVLNPYIMSVFKNFVINWFLTTTHYANFDVISGINKKFKLEYLINKTLESKSIK